MALNYYSSQRFSAKFSATFQFKLSSIFIHRQRCSPFLFLQEMEAFKPSSFLRQCLTFSYYVLRSCQPFNFLFTAGISILWPLQFVKKKKSGYHKVVRVMCICLGNKISHKGTISESGNFVLRFPVSPLFSLLGWPRLAQT